MTFDPVSLALMALIGAIAGWLAGQIMQGRGFGIIGNIIVGVLGAILAGVLLAGFIPITGLIGEVISATIGAIILLFVIGLVKKA